MQEEDCGMWDVLNAPRMNGMHSLVRVFQNIQPWAPVRIPKTEAPTTEPMREGAYCQSPRAVAWAAASTVVVVFMLMFGSIVIFLWDGEE
jgi:hypothetical protein